MAGFFDKIKQGASEAGKKAQQTVEINRLKMHVSSLEKDITKKYTQIGSAVYQASKNGDLSAAEAEVDFLCKEIQVIEKDIEATDLKIRELRNEKNCMCGRVVAVDAKFCPDCGHKFEIEQVIVAEPVAAAAEANQLACPSCNEPLEENAKFCGGCGHSLQS